MEVFVEKLDSEKVITARLNKVFLGVYPVCNEPTLNIAKGEVVIGRMLESNSQSLYSLFLDLTRELTQEDIHEWEKKMTQSNRNMVYQLWWREVMRENGRSDMFTHHATTHLQVRRDWFVVQVGNLK